MAAPVSMISNDAQIFFIYDQTYLKSEEDDIKDAIVYFYPSHMNDDSRCALCGQLMGMVKFFVSMTGTSPSIFTLTTNKFAIKHVQKYTLALAGSKCLPDNTLKKQLHNLYALFTFYHGTIHNIYQNHSENKAEFQLTLRHTWDSYLPFIHCYGDILSSTFFSLPRVTLPKKHRNVYLSALHLLQSCLRRPGVISGCIFFRNRVLCSQLNAQLTSKLLIIRPKQSHLPCQPVFVVYNLPENVRIISVYLTQEEYKSLSPLKCREHGFKHNKHSSFSTHSSRRQNSYPDEPWRDLSMSGYSDLNSMSSDHSMPELEVSSSMTSSRGSFISKVSTNHSFKAEHAGDQSDRPGGSFSGTYKSKEVQKGNILTPKMFKTNSLSPRESSVKSKKIDERSPRVKSADLIDIGVDTSDLGVIHFPNEKPENIKSSINSCVEGSEAQKNELVTSTSCSKITSDNKKLSNHSDCTETNIKSSSEVTDLQLNTEISWKSTCTYLPDGANEHIHVAGEPSTENDSDGLEVQMLVSRSNSDSNSVTYEGSDIDELADIIVRRTLDKIEKEFYASARCQSKVPKDADCDVRYEISDTENKTKIDHPHSANTDSNVHKLDETHSENSNQGVSRSPDNSVRSRSDSENDSDENVFIESSAKENSSMSTLVSETASQPRAEDKELSQLENLELYIQGYHDSVIVLVMEKDVCQDSTITKALYNTAASELEAINSHLKTLLKKEFTEGLNVQNNYFIQYDTIQRNLSGNILSPVSLEEHEFCETAIRMHEEFLTSPTLTDVTLRSHLGSTYGHCSMKQETYFHPWSSQRPTSGEPSEKDAAMLLDNRAQKRIANDNNLLLL